MSPQETSLRSLQVKVFLNTHWAQTEPSIPSQEVVVYSAQGPCLDFGLGSWILIQAWYKEQNWCGCHNFHTVLMFLLLLSKRTRMFSLLSCGLQLFYRYLGKVGNAECERTATLTNRVISNQGSMHSEWVPFAVLEEYKTRKGHSGLERWLSS